MDARKGVAARWAQSGAWAPSLAAPRTGARRRRGARDERRGAHGRRQSNHGRGGRLPRAGGAAVRAEHAEPQRPAARHAAAGLAAAGLPGRHAAYPDQPAGSSQQAARADHRQRVGHRRAPRPRGPLLPGRRRQLPARRALSAGGNRHGARPAARARALGAVRLPLHGVRARPDPEQASGQRARREAPWRCSTTTRRPA